MNHPFTRSLIASVVVTGAALLSMTGALAGGAQATHHSAPSAMTCPMCKMKMTSHWSKMAPKKVVVHGHAYYCCTGCGGKAPKKVMHKSA